MSKRTTAKELAVMLSWTANMAHKLTLGSVPPWMSAVGKRMREPRIGDLVMETTTQYGRGQYPAEMRIGRLVRETREPIAMEWDESEDGPKPTERVVYIMGLDGAEHRWTNASFIAIPAINWEDEITVDEEDVRRFQAGRRG